jgi:hypothetical protein
MVTHLTTNPPVRCLNRAERTGSLVFNALWSYVEEQDYTTLNKANHSCKGVFLILTSYLLCKLSYQTY